MIAACFVFFNFAMNEYGLFGDVSGRSIKIWHNDRTSKYLFSFNYIPSNFDGILMGPSVSANIDVKRLSGYKFYNISLGGGNVTELKYIADNAINRGKIKVLIICLYPYMTKDHGRKTTYIDPREFWGALGSRELVNLYINKIFIQHGMRPDFPDDHGTWLVKGPGLVTAPKAATRPFQERRKKPEDMLHIDETAYHELYEIVQSARNKGIRIFGYYYPFQSGALDAARFHIYQKRINCLFDKRDMIWDLNTDEYMFFKMDRTNYTATGHLSMKGNEFILENIQGKIDRFFQNLE